MFFLSSLCSVREQPVVWLIQEPPLHASMLTTSATSWGLSSKLSIVFPMHTSVIRELFDAFEGGLSFTGYLSLDTNMVDEGGKNAKKKKKGKKTSEKKHEKTHVVYISNSISDSQMAAIQRLHSEIFYTAALLIPPEGNALLTTSNFAPSRISLNNVFFADHISTKSLLNQKSYRVSHRNNNMLGPVESVFFHDEHPRSKEVRAVQGDEDEEVTSDSFSRCGTVGPTSSCRGIRDLPLGVRLVNSYRQAHKGDSIQIYRAPLKIIDRSDISLSGEFDEGAKNKDGSSVTEQSKNKSGNTDGSNDGVKGDGIGSKNALPPGVIKVSVKSVMPTWVSVPTSIRCILPRQSVPAVAVHRGKETLYGVAHSSLLVLGYKNSTINAGGVTLLPPGGLWISLALACVGGDTSEIHLNKIELKKKEKSVVIVKKEEKLKNQINSLQGHEGNNNFISDEVKPDFAQCVIVKEYMTDMLTRDLKPDKDLIAALNHIFESWVQK